MTLPGASRFNFGWSSINCAMYILQLPIFLWSRYFNKDFVADITKEQIHQVGFQMFSWRILDTSGKKKSHGLLGFSPESWLNHLWDRVTKFMVDFMGFNHGDQPSNFRGYTNGYTGFHVGPLIMSWNMLKFRKGELRSGCGIWIFESETPKNRPALLRMALEGPRTFITRMR